MMDFSSLRNDPEFVALPFSEKLKAAAMIDKQFAALDPAEQQRGMRMLFPDVREQIAARSAEPPLAAHGDPNAAPSMTAGNIAGAITRGVVSPITGIAHAVAHPIDTASSIVNNLTAPARAVMQNRAPTADENISAVPLVGPPVAALTAPARAVMHNNAPTHEQNVNAIEAGTGLAVNAALMSPRGSAEIGMSTAPLTESLGARLAGKMDEVPKFKNPARQTAQLDALHEKYPNAEIVSKGDSFVVRHTPEAPPPAEHIPLGKGVVEGAKLGSGGGALVGATGGVPGAVVGAKIGGVLGGGAVLAKNIATNVINSPLWRVASSKLKTSLGKALQSGDTEAANVIAAQVLGAAGMQGMNDLAPPPVPDPADDEYGHDAALHSLIADITQNSGGTPPSPAQLHQHLQDYDAIYVQPNGVPVPVPYNVQRQTFNAISGHR